jgi:drug/metabolite transporter (DMT)-like permease
MSGLWSKLGWSFLVCGALGIAIGAAIPLIAGDPNQILTGLGYGLLGGLLYGCLFGITLHKTRKRNRMRRESGFLLSRMTFLVPICVALGFVPGGLIGVWKGPQEFGGIHGEWTPLTIVLGLMLSIYVAVLWIRMLQRGPA